MFIKSVRFKSLLLKARGLKRAREPKSSGDDDVDVKEPKAKKKASIPTTTTPSDSHGKDTFKGYPLKELPREAWPQPGEHKGSHSYTLKGSNGAAPCFEQQFSNFMKCHPKMF